MTRLYRYLRRWLTAYGLAPTSRLGRFAAYLAVMDLAFFVAAQALRWANAALGTAAILSTWVGFFNFILVLLGSILAFRWIRRHLMWRLRNRLIVTYVFIGVIPVVLLVAMAGIAAYLFAGQFATYLATADLQGELAMLDSANSVVTTHIASELRAGRSPAVIASALRAGLAAGDTMPPEICFWYRGERTAVQSSGDVAIAAPPPWLKPDFTQFRAVAATSTGLHLRVARRIDLNGQPLVVYASRPLGQKLLEKIAASLGVVTFYVRDLEFDENGAHQNVTVQLNQEGLDVKTSPGKMKKPGRRMASENLAAGKLPDAQHRFDRLVTFGTPFPVTDWVSGKDTEMLMSVQTRPSALYHRLFLAQGSFAVRVLQALIIIAVFFALIEIIALFIGIRLTRTVTRSVAELYKATQRIERGDLDHRIKVRSSDQLAALETSFNTMTESLQKLLAEQKEKERIQNELAIAQEVQEQLFPRHAAQLETLEVFGLCRPARTVSGDYYDFLQLGYEKLGIALGDVSGKGISAALLMATIHSAVRAYTLDRLPQATGVEARALEAVLAGSGGNGDAMADSSMAGDITMPPADLMALLNRQLFRSTPMEKYATMFFGTYDGLSRTLTYSNAGHLPPVVLSSNGTRRRLDMGGTVIGLFDGMPYEQAAVELRPGDILISFSDGITEPENEFGEFGEHRLVELVQENRDLPLDRVADAVITAVLDWIGGAEQPDDITLVLARAR